MTKISNRKYETPPKFLPLSCPSLAQTHCQGPLFVNGSGKSLTDEELSHIKEELEELKTKHGWKEPTRQFMDDPLTVWMFDGVPDYSLTNYFFLKERTYQHKPGSIEETVENLIKTWEMERSHKPDCLQHQTTDPINFRFSANGGAIFNNVEAHQVGNYNVLLNTCPKEYYDAENITWSESHVLFHKAFPAFPWEVLQVFAGPPKVAFTWRHWAHFTGTYQGIQGKGQLVEMIGFCTAVVNEEMKIGELEVYFDPISFFKALRGTNEEEEKEEGEISFDTDHDADEDKPNPDNCSCRMSSGTNGDDIMMEISDSFSSSSSSSSSSCPITGFTSHHSREQQDKSNDGKPVNERLNPRNLCSTNRLRRQQMSAHHMNGTIGGNSGGCPFNHSFVSK